VSGTEVHMRASTQTHTHTHCHGADGPDEPIALPTARQKGKDRMTWKTRSPAPTKRTQLRNRAHVTSEMAIMQR